MADSKYRIWVIYKDNGKNICFGKGPDYVSNMYPVYNKSIKAWNFTDINNKEYYINNDALDMIMWEDLNENR